MCCVDTPQHATPNGFCAGEFSLPLDAFEAKYLQLRADVCHPGRDSISYDLLCHVVILQ